jgi:hypothetical protein
MKAAELRAQAKFESNPEVQADLENLALSYLRLAEQAERNAKLDVSYETPPNKDGEPEIKP